MENPLTPIQVTVLEELAKGRKLFEVLAVPLRPTKAEVDAWGTCPRYAAQLAQALAAGALKRVRQRTQKANKVRRAPPSKRSAQRAAKAGCSNIGLDLFLTSTWVLTPGHPTTPPNTKADRQRIQQSQRLTAIIGDSYVTPGAGGYTPEELAQSAVRYAHLSIPERPERPEGELKARLLELLRAGVLLGDAKADLELGEGDTIRWCKEDPEFRIQFAAAKLESREVRKASGGTTRSYNRTRQNPVRPPEQRIGARRKAAAVNPRALPLATPTPPLAPAPYMEPKEQDAPLSALQQQAISYVSTTQKNTREVMLRGEIEGFNLAVLKQWRKDPVFLARWETAMEQNYRNRGQKRPASQALKRAATPRPVNDPLANPRVKRTTEDLHEVQFTEPNLPSTEAPQPQRVLPVVREQTELPNLQVLQQMELLFGAEQVLSYCRLSAYQYRLGPAANEAVAKWYEDRLRMYAAFVSK